LSVNSRFGVNFIAQRYLEKTMHFYTKLVVAVVVLVGIEIAWLYRWEVVPASTEELPIAYQLDRWTGAVHFLGAPADGRVRLQDK
jgi:hypothetical protein